MSDIENDFKELFLSHDEELLSFCQYIINQKSSKSILCRKFIGHLHLEATWLQEAMDSYGALRNEKWFICRNRISIIKLFTSVCYTVLHIKAFIPRYQLIPIKDSFESETEKVLKVLYQAIYKTADSLLKHEKKYQKQLELKDLTPDDFCENRPIGSLKIDRQLRDVDKGDKTLVHLATMFLNLGMDVGLLEESYHIKEKYYSSSIPELINEEKLRLVQTRFHNLQSSYDTYLSKSIIERKDPRLMVLRGHISIIFHLLECATDFIHYYQRHMISAKSSPFKTSIIPLSEKEHLNILFNYFIKFAHLYFEAAKELCRSIISEYAEIGRIEVPIPEYRGFHVRPSTLISKIINHYGSNIVLKMGRQEYDASITIELFRVNEEINAAKRRYIGAFIQKHGLLEKFAKIQRTDWPKKLKYIIFDLMEKDEVILYDQNLTFETNIPDEDECAEEYCKRMIVKYLGAGKFDIKSDLTVTFIGDKRVLTDLKIFAENGYGEDKYGNNIPLPCELTYLRR
ncbi:MAG: hypothetical protein MJB14_19925 [Spirochaetes bacterium]|nr:hypothetical protein [Spirochaetota bacterium]